MPSLAQWHLWRERAQGWLLRHLSRAEQGLEVARRRLLPPELVLFRDVTAPWLASALCVAARLGLADRVGEGGQELSALAREVEIPEVDLARLLSVLEAHGYFQRAAVGAVRNTALSHALRRDRAGSFAELQGRGWYRKAFHSGRVVQGWREGETPFKVGTGEPFFDFLAARPGAERLFSAAMADVTRFCAPFLASEIRLAKESRVLDVGGGDGVLVAALSQRYRPRRLAVLDRAASGDDRASTLGWERLQGDFFQALPGGFDHLLLKNILHDWDDEGCLRLLRCCREAVASGDRLTVIECLLPDLERGETAEALPFALDWNVWMTLSGRERTLSVYQALLKQTGWRLQAVRRTATPYRLLEAVAF